LLIENIIKGIEKIRRRGLIVKESRGKTKI